VTTIGDLGGPLDWDSVPPQRHGDGAGDAKQAARQFEAMLIGQMLRSMREASGNKGNWLGGEEAQGSDTMSEFAEQQLGQAISSQGGFGLAPLVEQGLKPHESTSTNSTAEVHRLSGQRL